MTPDLPDPRARYMSPQQIATHFGISKMSVYRLIHAGELAAVRVGRVYRVPVSAVVDFEAKHQLAAS